MRLRIRASSAISTTVGGLPAKARSRAFPPISAVSSSPTIFTTCWPGLSASSTSTPRARSPTLAVNSLTTWKLTSASSSASRTWRMAFETSSSVSLPRERTSERADWRRSERVSSTGAQATRPGRSAAVGDRRQAADDVPELQRADLPAALAGSSHRAELELAAAGAVVLRPHAAEQDALPVGAARGDGSGVARRDDHRLGHGCERLGAGEAVRERLDLAGGAPVVDRRRPPLCRADAFEPVHVHEGARAAGRDVGAEPAGGHVHALRALRGDGPTLAGAQRVERLRLAEESPGAAVRDGGHLARPSTEAGALLVHPAGLCGA